MSWSFYDANGKMLQGVLAVSIDTTELADDAVTADKLANSINTDIAANTAKVTNATHTGDVTGATALTIATDAVEGSMVHANVVDDTTLEQNGTQFRLKDNGVTLAKMAGITRGSIIYGNSSGDPTALALGTSGLALKSDGTDLVYGSAGVSLGLVIALGG
jgi:hypothetical protein